MPRSGLHQQSALAKNLFVHARNGLLSPREGGGDA